jgi:hypothetical protein
MSLRQFHHPVSSLVSLSCSSIDLYLVDGYSEPIIRKSVPLVIGLVSVSNSQLPILDTLSKYSYDNDLAAALAQRYLCNGPRRCREPTT